MFSIDSLDRVLGSTAYDSTGEKVGSVDEVYLDDRTGRPTWVSINTGLFGMSTSFAPLADAILDGDDLRLAYTKDQVKDAPRIDADQHLSLAQEGELYRHYGVVDETPADALRLRRYVHTQR